MQFIIQLLLCASWLVHFSCISRSPGDFAFTVTMQLNEELKLLCMIMPTIARSCSITYSVQCIFPNQSVGIQEYSSLTLSKFQARFNTTVYAASSSSSVDFLQTVERLGCEMIYIIKSGIRFADPNGKTIQALCVPSAVHSVFFWEPHGTTYAAISPDLTRFRSELPVVHHIVRPVDMNRFNARVGMRNLLNISDSAMVVCRHGGKDSFDLDFVHDAIITILQYNRYDRSKLQFLYLNTNPFYFINGTVVDHPQLIFLPAIIKEDEKEEFIRTCDVMLHGRSIGETFGLAIAEFSVHNKPVITHPGKSNFHIHTLGDKGIIYKNGPHLIQILEGLLANGIPQKDYNAYRQFAPELVIQEFKRHFLDPIFNKTKAG